VFLAATCARARVVSRMPSDPELRHQAGYRSAFSFVHAAKLLRRWCVIPGGGLPQDGRARWTHWAGFLAGIGRAQEPEADDCSTVTPQKPRCLAAFLAGALGPEPRTR
jgi:hypothetical protein